jgi:hypothetical protein
MSVGGVASPLFAFHHPSHLDHSIQKKKSQKNPALVSNLFILHTTTTLLLFLPHCST